MKEQLADESIARLLIQEKAFRLGVLFWPNSAFPHAEKNYPTDEHLLPLFVALGVGGVDVKGMQLHHSSNYGAFSIAAYAFTGSV